MGYHAHSNQTRVFLESLSTVICQQCHYILHLFHTLKRLTSHCQMHEESSVNDFTLSNAKLPAQESSVMEFATHCNKFYTDNQLPLDYLKRAVDMVRISKKV